MTNEFKKTSSNKKDETRYVLENGTAGATVAGAGATIPMPMGQIRKRVKEEPAADATQKKSSDPDAVPNGPLETELDTDSPHVMKVVNDSKRFGLKNVFSNIIAYVGEAEETIKQLRKAYDEQEKRFHDINQDYLRNLAALKANPTDQRIQARADLLGKAATTATDTADSNTASTKEMPTKEDHSDYAQGFGKASYDSYSGTRHGRGVMEDPYQQELANKLMEKLAKDATVGDYIHDFAKSTAPQFRGKTKKKREEMAIAAHYAAQQPKKSRRKKSRR